MFKKMFMFGISNIDLSILVYKSIKEILKDIKDFEPSYEIKLAIYSMLLITKDRQAQQEDVLRALSGVLKSLQDFISKIDVKFGNAKPPTVSSAKRSTNDTGVTD